MVSHDRYFVNRVANKIIYLQNKQFIIEEGNYEEFSKIHDITNVQFTYMLKKEEKEKKDEVIKPKRVSTNSSKEKMKIEKEIEKLMLELEELNEKISNEEASYNWVEYKEIDEQIKQIEEKIESLMLKLEKLNG